MIRCAQSSILEIALSYYCEMLHCFLVWWKKNLDIYQEILAYLPGKLLNYGIEGNIGEIIDRGCVWGQKGSLCLLQCLVWALYGMRDFELEPPQNKLLHTHTSEASSESSNCFNIRNIWLV